MQRIVQNVRVDDLVVFGVAMGEIISEEKLSIPLMESYEIAKKAYQEWCDIVPNNFNWEAHYALEGEDWDMEIRKYLKKYLKTNNLL